MISATLFRVSCGLLWGFLSARGVVDRAYVLAAVIFESWAFLPVCLSPAWVSERYTLASKKEVFS
jgi:hypothetical protein